MAELFNTPATASSRCCRPGSQRGILALLSAAGWCGSGGCTPSVTETAPAAERSASPLSPAPPVDSTMGPRDLVVSVEPHDSWWAECPTSDCVADAIPHSESIVDAVRGTWCTCGEKKMLQFDGYEISIDGRPPETTSIQPAQEASQFVLVFGTSSDWVFDDPRPSGSNELRFTHRDWRRSFYRSTSDDCACFFREAQLR
jgi:hypothetical protein